MNIYKQVFPLLIILFASLPVYGQDAAMPAAIENLEFNPSTLLWYDSPAGAWEEALPVGNGRLGAMVFGKYGEERIQLNEETYWSGGPYSTVVEGGAAVLPDIQKFLFEVKFLLLLFALTHQNLCFDI